MWKKGSSEKKDEPDSSNDKKTGEVKYDGDLRNHESIEKVNGE